VEYEDFLESKKLVLKSSGIEVAESDINPKLFDFQKQLTRWSLRKGRCALFADTGLGKSPMQLEWSRLTGQKTLILAPLSVAKQTVGEGKKFDVEVKYVRSQAECDNPICITNYEMIDHFDPDQFGAVVADESGILKGLDGKTRQKLTDMFRMTPYKLCCTATPAPNDITEIANHAEFLGIMSRANMLAMFFTHDDAGWRLKKHAVEPFYRWLASWAMAIRFPSDLGYSDEGFILPPLNIIPHYVELDYVPDGQLLWDGDLKGIQDRARVRKETTEARVKTTAEMVNGDSEQWIIWCGLNEEARQAHKAMPDSVNVEGNMSTDDKQDAIERFQDGKYRVLVTKGKICGFGLNMQHCHKMAFLGMNDSYELMYQAIRREYRFGQKFPVDVHIVTTTIERGIYENVLRKEKEAGVMTQKLIENVKEFEKAEIGVMDAKKDYVTTKEIQIPEWLGGIAV
jgi:superfamily II DNA or RNA helicase